MFVKREPEAGQFPTLANESDARNSYRSTERKEFVKVDRNCTRRAFLPMGKGWRPETVEEWEKIGWELASVYDARIKAEEAEKAEKAKKFEKVK